MMYVNLYKGKEDKIWSGRTIFESYEEAISVPCATTAAYIKTMRLEDDSLPKQRSTD